MPQSQSKTAEIKPNIIEEPHNLEAESLLLGILLRDDSVLDEIDWLHEKFFYSPVNSSIFTLLRKLHTKGNGYNFVTIKDLLQNDTEVIQAGGISYLSGLLGNFSPATSLIHYAKLIHNHFLRRKILSICNEYSRRIYFQGDSDAKEVLESLEIALFKIAESDTQTKDAISLNESIDNSLALIQASKDRNSQYSGLTTGFEDLDSALSGLHSADLIILAGRPAMGKTALAVNIALNVSKAWNKHQNEKGETIEEGAYVLFFSLEMSNEQLSMRILSQEANVNSNKLRNTQNLQEKDISRLQSAADTLSDTPLYVDDVANITVLQILQRARRFKRKHKGHLGLIVIDYLQLIQSGSDLKYSNKVQEITNISRDLKLLARELNLPVIALSQLSREVERRPNKRPQLSDLRESGAIEQDADVVMFLYREEYYIQQAGIKQELDEDKEDFEVREEKYFKRLDEVKGKAELIIAKYRHGPTTDIDMIFQAEQSKFLSISTSRNKYSSY